MDPTARLLLVEDDETFGHLLIEYLTPVGYDVEIAANHHAALVAARNGAYDAVIWDVMVTEQSGVEVMRELRRTSPAPILMLTPVGNEADRDELLELATELYLPKTFSTREFLSHVRAVLRRSPARGAAHRPSRRAPISVGPLRLEPTRRAVTQGGRALTLTNAEFELLLTLARAPGRVLSREHLLREAAERDFDMFDRSIDVRISALRRKLGDDARHPRVIETVRGAGYRLRLPQDSPE